jgi:hypothetical protein
MTNEELLNELKSRFPGIDQADGEMNGGDTVNALCQWYDHLKAEWRKQFMGGCTRVKYWPIDAPTDEETEMERGRR